MDVYIPSQEAPPLGHTVIDKGFFNADLGVGHASVAAAVSSISKSGTKGGHETAETVRSVTHEALVKATPQSMLCRQALIARCR